MAEAVSVTRLFPRSWLITATIIRSGGTDRRGNPLPEERFTVADCLVDPGTTSDPVDRSDAPSTTCWLLAPGRTDIVSTDRVELPIGSPYLSGEFEVDGEPKPTPLGVSIPLRRGS